MDYHEIDWSHTSMHTHTHSQQHKGSPFLLLYAIFMDNTPWKACNMQRVIFVAAQRNSGSYCLHMPATNGEKLAHKRVSYGNYFPAARRSTCKGSRPCSATFMIPMSILLLLSLLCAIHICSCIIFVDSDRSALHTDRCRRCCWWWFRWWSCDQFGLVRRLLATAPTHTRTPTPLAGMPQLWGTLWLFARREYSARMLIHTRIHIHTC